jgi:hypothetical protein
MNPEAVILLITSSARVVSPRGAISRARRRSWFVDLVGWRRFKNDQGGAGRSKWVSGNESHGEPGKDLARN